METLSFEGEFWLPNNPDRKVAGVLNFSQENGGELSLIGSFSDVSAFLLEGAQNPGRIIGHSDKNIYTLDQCFQTYSQFTLRGKRQKFHVGLIIEGAAYAEDEPLEFDGIGVEVANFLNWAGVSGVTRLIPREGDAEYKLSVRKLEDRTSPFESGELRIRHGYRTEAKTSREYTLTQSADVKFSFTSTLTLSKALDFASDLQDLVAIATDRASAFKEILLYHPSFATSHGHQNIRLYRQQIAKVEPEKTLAGDSVAFRFEDFGGIEALARWINTCNTYRSHLGRVMATKHQRRLYLEDRFFGRAVALESLHRAHTGIAERNYVDRIKDYIANVEDQFRQLVPIGRFDTWAKTVKDDRNNIAHHLGRNIHQDQSELYYFGEAVYWLFILNYLKITGVPVAVFDQIIDNRHFKWTAERMADLLT
ncbi:HEPN domain-containing protein [Actinomadura luteofluorescens]|uniref:ApeA N-terminal domain 1-containing protein n=1 Tax=Actinomadura luteofluorescens TaxID=46163 RepID=UPI003D9129FB